MNQAQWIKDGIVRGGPFYLNKQNPIFHNCLNVFFLALIIVATVEVALSKKLLPAVAYIPLASLAFGYLFNLLGILVVHEAAHNMFVTSKNKRLAQFGNRFFGWMISIPFAINYYLQWEKGHIMHHLYIGEREDPESCRPRTGKELLQKVGKILLIPGYFHYFGLMTGKGFTYECTAGGKPPLNWKGALRLCAFWILLLLLVKDYVSTGGILSVSAAIFLGMQVSAAINIVRESLEHGGAIITKDNFFLRTHSTLSPIRHITQPFNEFYHFEHHLNSNIPWYNLKKYYEALNGVTPAEIRPFLYTVGIRDTRDQLAGKKSPIPTEIINQR